MLPFSIIGSVTKCVGVGTAYLLGSWEPLAFLTQSFNLHNFFSKPLSEISETALSTFLVIFDLRMSDTWSMRHVRDHDIRFLHCLIPPHTDFQLIRTIS